MKQTLFATAYLTDDYDAAIAWFRAALGWVLLEDTDMGGGKRWVRVAPHEGAETSFLIARAVMARAWSQVRRSSTKSAEPVAQPNSAASGARALVAENPISPWV